MEDELGRWPYPDGPGGPQDPGTQLPKYPSEEHENY
jgi:hypothetical protein